MSESPAREESEQPDLELIGPAPIDDSDDSNDGPLPSAAEGKSAEVYEVQKVLAHHLSPDGVFLKVRWEGYGEDEDSWEPEIDLKECADDIVKEYMNSLPDKEKKAILKFRRDLAAQESKKKKTPAPKAKVGRKPKTVAKRDIEMNHESPKTSKYKESSDDSDSDTGSKRKSRSKKREKSKDDSFGPKEKKTKKQEKTAVTTKAALKQYPSSARQAAIKHRQTWLNDSDSSDNERDDGIENSTSFDDEIKAKVQTKKRERIDNKVESVVTPKNNRGKSRDADLEDVQRQSSPAVSLKNVDTNDGTAEMVLEMVNSIDQSMSEQEIKEVSSDWKIEGITQHNNGNNKTIIVLLSNINSGEKKAVSTLEAYNLAGWNLCNWLIQRCTF